MTGEISIDKIEVDLGMNKIIEEEILEAMQDHIRILEDRIVEENTECRNEDYSRERARSRSGESYFSRNNNNNKRNNRSVSNSISTS